MADNSAHKYRVLVPLDCYNARSVSIVAPALRDAGFEVLYTGPTGLDHSPGAIVDAALQEDADAICVSSLHSLDLQVLEIFELLKRKGRKDVLLFGGGLITPQEAEELSKEGLGRFFGPGTDVRDVAAYLCEELPRRRPPRP